jgi:hypothetical protein
LIFIGEKLLEALLQVPATSTSFPKTGKKTTVNSLAGPAGERRGFAFGLAASDEFTALLCVTLYTLSQIPATSRKSLIFIGEKLLEALLQVPATPTSFPKTGKKTPVNRHPGPDGERRGFAFCRSKEAWLRLQVID